MEAPEKVCEALVLFCQGQGLMPTLNRRGSRPSITFSQATDSSRSEILRLTMEREWWLCCTCGRRMTVCSDRKMSMTDYDVPDIRRLSVTARGRVGEQTGET